MVGATLEQFQVGERKKFILGLRIQPNMDKFDDNFTCCLTYSPKNILYYKLSTEADRFFLSVRHFQKNYKHRFFVRLLFFVIVNIIGSVWSI